MCKAVMSMFLFTNKDSQLMSEEILQIQAKLLSCVLAQLSRNQSIYLLWKVSLYKCYTFHRRIILIKTFWYDARTIWWWSQILASACKCAAKLNLKISITSEPRANFWKCNNGPFEKINKIKRTVCNRTRFSFHALI